MLCWAYFLWSRLALHEDGSGKDGQGQNQFLWGHIPSPPLMRACACASRGDAAFTSKPHHIARTRATSLSALLQSPVTASVPPNHGPAWPASRPKNRLPIHPLPGGPMNVHGCFTLFFSVCLNLPLFVVGLAGRDGRFNALEVRTQGQLRVSTEGPRGRLSPSTSGVVWLGCVTKSILFPSGLDDAVAYGMAGHGEGHVCLAAVALPDGRSGGHLNGCTVRQPT
jgi:hypothetical protein